MKVVINKSSYGLRSFKLLLAMYLNCPESLGRERGSFVKEEVDAMLFKVEGRHLYYDEVYSFWYDPDRTYDCIYTEEGSYFLPSDDYFRSNPDLIKVLESDSSLLKDEYVDLKIVEIPDDVEYEIRESYLYGEFIREVSRSWS